MRAAASERAEGKTTGDADENRPSSSQEQKPGSGNPSKDPVRLLLPRSPHPSTQVGAQVKGHEHLALKFLETGGCRGSPQAGLQMAKAPRLVGHG